MQGDLRDWLQKVEAIGSLRRFECADWELEIGTAIALNLQGNVRPALLFDNIKDYPKGYRVLSCTGSTARLIETTFNLPVTDSNLQLLATLKEKLPQWEANLDKFPPEVVSSGPVLENILSGDDVDLFKFPVPKLHSLDGGRYIGTGHAVITKDPDTGDINLGTYRLHALDKKTTGWFMVPNQHGDLHRRKYHERGKRCPVAVSIGHHPLIFRVSCIELPIGTEYQFAGAIREKPVKVITEEITGLPIPADSEIVLAGWCPPDVNRTEGPFGEWTGYYAGGETYSPIIEVERIYHRNEPILVCSAPNRPALNENAYYLAVVLGTKLWNELTRAGIPDIKGVWLSQEGGYYLVVISVKQRYAGHAKQAALLAPQLRTIGRQGRYVIVVDEDVDPTNMGEVLWAMCTRSDPAKDIDILRDCTSTRLDPVIRRPAEACFSSRAIIDACKPYEWIDEFPKSVDFEPEVVERVRRKWEGLGR